MDWYSINIEDYLLWYLSCSFIDKSLHCISHQTSGVGGETGVAGAGFRSRLTNWLLLDDFISSVPQNFLLPLSYAWHDTYRLFTRIGFLLS